MLLFSTASQGLLIQSPGGGTQEPRVLRGKLVNNTPRPEAPAFSQATSQLENSGDLDNSEDRPQQLNDNRDDDAAAQGSPFIAFEQVSNNFGIGNIVSPVEGPRAGLEIDLGPVDDVGPREEINFSQQQQILFQTTEEDQESQTFFGGGEIILEQKKNNLEDLGIVKEFASDPVDNDRGTFVRVVSSDTINTGDNNEALNIPVIIEEGPLAEVETGVEAIKDNRVTDQIRFNEQPPAFEQLQVQTDNGDFSPVFGFSESSFRQPEEGQRQIIDLTDPKSIIPRIPGNTVSFSFTRFGAGDKATSFGLNLNNDNNIKSVGTKFQTKFNNIIVNGEQNSGSGSDVFFTTPTPTRSPSTTRPPRVSTSSPVRFNAVVRTTTATTTTTTTRRSTRVTTRRPTTTSRPVVFSQKPVTFVESQPDRSRLKSERLRLQSTRPPGVPGFELFRIPAAAQADLPRLNVVKAAPPPRPRGPPPPSPTPPSQTPQPRRPPGPTEAPRRPPAKQRIPPLPVVNQVFFSQSPAPVTPLPPVTRQPLFVFSTPGPGSRSPTPGPDHRQLPSSTLRPVTPHVTPFSVDVTTRNPFVFHSSPSPFVHEISIPINISETSSNAKHRQNINSPPPPHVKQLERKPKNQFLTGSGFGNSLLSSPFVFLRQQLEEVKANIGLPGQSGQVNPFLQHSVTPQPTRPQFFPTGNVAPTPISPFVFNNPGARPSVPNSGAQFFSLGPTRAPVAINPFSASPTDTRLPAGTFVFRDPTQPVLSPVSPTPIPLSPAVASTTPQPRPDTTRTTSRPIIFSQPTIKPLEGVLLEQDRNNGLDQHIELIIEETSTEDSLQSQNIVKVGKEKEDDTESNETEPSETDKLPPFDPRKRRITKKPKLVSAISSNNLSDERNVLAKKQKPSVSIQQDFDSSTEDLQDRLRRLKESIRKTKESLTSQRQNLFVFSPSSTTAAPAHRGVRKRVKSRKRIPPRVRQQQRLQLEENNDAGEISASNEINIPISIVERPRSSGRGRDRSRARGRIRNKIQDIEKDKTDAPSAKTRQEQKNELLERELEETYGKDVVQGLLGVLVTAVSHPDKDRILHQLKAQLSAMNVNDVKKLEFGAERHRSPPTTATTTTVKPEIVTSTTTTLAPDSEAEEKSSEFESALELQLKRVANLANRFKSNKPILVNTQKQTIQSKLPLKVAEKFPVTIPRKIQETLGETTTTEKEPTFMPTVSPSSTEKTVTSGLSTTLRNLFQTDRVQKIMMSPTTPASVSDSLIEGVPNGEPGLTKNFYERVASFSEDAIGPLEVTTTSSVLEKTEPEEENLEIVLPLEIVEINESTTANSAVEEIVNIGFNNVGTKTVSRAHELENSIKKMMENVKLNLNLKESAMTENEIQNLHAEMIVKDEESATVRPSFEKLVIKDRKEEETKEQIFNSSDLVLTNFMVDKVKESKETAGNDVNEPATTAKTTTTSPTADQTTEAAKMVPTPLSKDADFKSRRRNLFRNQNGKIKKGSLLGKFKKFDRSRFRKLQRNHKPGSSNSSSDQNIIIEEKKNPRKIIFRKNLIRGERRRVPASLNNDPLVKSLQRQIKSQKSKLFLSRKRPFTKLETTPQKTEKVQF